MIVEAGVDHDGEASEEAAERSFGLMRMGGALLALSVESIREVIPGWKTYSPMPVRASGLKGAVSLRGTTIPVLDLRHDLGLEARPQAEHVIVILRRQGRLIGLTADEVCGIARVRQGDLFELDFAATPTGGQLATHTFRNGEDVATILSAERIAALPNLPMVAERAVARQGRSKATESVLLFTCGPSHFGIDATFVDATVPKVRLERNALTSGFCLGVIEHHGFEVPVVDTRAAIGVGFEPPPAESEVIVLRFGPEAMLGFVIDEVRDIARVATADIRALPAFAAGASSLFRGMLADADGREHLLLDMARIRQDPRLSSLAHLRKPKVALRRDAATGAGPKAAGPTKAFLTYAAGAERASELTQVSAILTYPENVAPFGAEGEGLIGFFTYRGQVVPLVCLSSVLGRPGPIDRSSARVLIVEDGPNMLGFVVQALRSIEPASWHSPPAAGPRETGIFQALVLVGLGENRQMLSHVDLARQAAGLIAAMGGAGGGKPDHADARQAVSEG